MKMENSRRKSAIPIDVLEVKEIEKPEESRPKKIVPKDIKISPTMLLWWYLGDGYLNKTKARPNYRRVMLCTQGFSSEDVYFLINKLKAILGNNIYRDKKRNIMISQETLCEFIDFIESDCPVDSYKYKFDFGQYRDYDYKAKSYATRVG